MVKPRKFAAVKVEDLPVGSRTIVTIDDRSIGIFNVHGTVIAVLNLCPHQFAPVCQGRVSGTTASAKPGELKWVRGGDILYCPWHGWEFDLLTGACLTDRRRLQRFATSVEDGWVYVELGPSSSN
jgi:nitrite reductase (NADH) small subunit